MGATRKGEQRLKVKATEQSPRRSPEAEIARDSRRPGVVRGSEARTGAARRGFKAERMSKKHKSPPLSAPDRGREEGEETREILLRGSDSRQWIGLSGRRGGMPKPEVDHSLETREERVKASSHDTEA